MKKLNLFLIGLMAVAMMSVFTACDPKEEEEVKFELLSLKAGTIDLNGATAAAGVPANTAITAVFSKNVDAASFAATMLRDYDDASITVTPTISGATVTITPAEQGPGTLYMLSLDAVKSADADVLAAVSRSYTTDGNFVPAGVVAYWPFDGDASDAIGSYDPTAAQVVDITYGVDRKGTAGKAAVFNGETSIIEVSNGDNLIKTENFSLSFWVKTNSANKTNGHFVIGLGAFYGIQFEMFGGYDGAKFAISYNFNDTNSTSEDMWFPSNATDATNGGWQGCDYAKSITPENMALMLKDSWLQVTYTYDGVERKGTLYYNGEKMKSFDFDLWPEGDAKRVVSGLTYRGAAPEVVNELAFGFIQSRAGTMWDAESWGGYNFPTSNHFKGTLDEVRIFHKAISAQEVELLYNSEKPAK